MLEAKRLSWDKYVKCNPRPDAASDMALNTFLSQGADEQVKLQNVAELFMKVALDKTTRGTALYISIR